MIGYEKATRHRPRVHFNTFFCATHARMHDIKDFHIVLAFTLIPGAEVCQLVSLEKAPFAEGNAFDAASLQQRFDNPECSSCSAHSRPKSDICARNAIRLRRMRRCVRMNSSLSTVQCGKLILTRICLLYSAVHTNGFESIYHSN